MVQKWTGKSLGSRFFQNLLGIFIKYGGRWTAYFVLYPIVLFYTFLPSVRIKASFYLKHRFPNSGKISLWFKTYKLNFTFGKILIDRAVLGIRGDIKIISSKKDQQLCRDLVAQGKGLIIISAHCGCWQAAMSSFDFLEGEKYVVYHRSKKDVDKHAHELSGKQSLVQFIDPNGFGGGTIEIMSVLAKKGIVCMMGDRTFGGKIGKENFIKVDFLGGKINIPFSIYRIAGATGVPIAVIFFPYQGSGKVDSLIPAAFFVEDKGHARENYFQEAQKFIQSLEEFTKKYPYQFYNYYDMWS
ncbi:lysophospholipid acyltransferase family protein [Endomicrobium proavitum]|uniref:Putative Lipid A biosynthesis acyltransferase n=1 Tax=Endomicrobium proavitum TaxID=1408281 RepID=A0A0G3WI01_9BACT|nr:lysophospholipid acyltransferase family protein [Endomicrobium proavitum]AKL98316.1 putative Lipid A biosynthesis acyltransferase [Endomicrobium proavitum]